MGKIVFLALIVSLSFLAYYSVENQDGKIIPVEHLKEDANEKIYQYKAISEILSNIDLNNRTVKTSGRLITEDGKFYLEENASLRLKVIAEGDLTKNPKFFLNKNLQIIGTVGRDDDGIVLVATSGSPITVIE